MNNKGYVFITGATSGIGLSSAQRLLDAGYHIIAGCYPSIAEGESLKQLSADSVTLLKIDVTNQDSIVAATENIIELVGEQGLKGLINSAGVALVCPVEHTTHEELLQMININLIGTFAVTRAMLPLLRIAKGTLVNISSDAGLLSMPTGAAYCASKFGVEAFSDAIRGEVRSQGIKVVIVEPGNIDTPIWDVALPPLRAKYDALDTEQKRLYGKLFRGLLGIERHGIPVERVSDKIYQIFHTKSPRTRYRVGLDAHISWLIGFLPARLRELLALKVVESYAKKT